MGGVGNQFLGVKISVILSWPVTAEFFYLKTWVFGHLFKHISIGKWMEMDGNGWKFQCDTLGPFPF